MSRGVISGRSLGRAAVARSLNLEASGMCRSLIDVQTRAKELGRHPPAPINHRSRVALGWGLGGLHSQALGALCSCRQK